MKTRCAFPIRAALLVLLGAILAGCSSSSKESSSHHELKVPANAKVIGDVKGQINYTQNVPADGRIWLEDGTDQIVLARQHVREGQNLHFTTEGRSAALTVDGRAVKTDRALDPNHAYRIYFEKE